MGNARSIFKKVKSLNENRVSRACDTSDYMYCLIENNARRTRTDKKYLSKVDKQATENRLNGRVANIVQHPITHIALNSRKRDGTYFIDHIWY